MASGGAASAFKVAIEQGTRKGSLTNWRPIIVLNCAYKVYARAIEMRLTNHMKEWICKEQKGLFQRKKYH